MKNLKVALISILVASAAAPIAPPIEEVLEPYIGEFEGAIKSAQDRNVPILVHVVQEGEEANERYRSGVLPDEDLTKRSRMATVLVVNDGTHDQKTVKINRGDEVVTRKVCRYFLTPTCSDHQLNWTTIFRKFNTEGEMKTPQALVLTPDGELHKRLYEAGEPPAVASFLEAMNAVEKKVGPGLTIEQLRDVKRLVGEARSRKDVKDWGGTWRKWQAVLEIQAQGKFANKAKREQPIAVEALKAELDAALKLLVADTVCQGYRSLTALADNAKDTPLAREVAKAVKRAERDKAIKNEIRSCKLELEAEGLWDQAQIHFRAGDEKKKGALLIRKLLKKKYDATGIVQRAREVYPDLWAKEEAKRKK